MAIPLVDSVGSISMQAALLKSVDSSGSGRSQIEKSDLRFVFGRLDASHLGCSAAEGFGTDNFTDAIRSR